MTNKNLIVLAGVAVVLAGAAYFANEGKNASSPKLNGKLVLSSFKVADVARIEVGDKLAIAAGEGGWAIETCHGYPADREKIVENLLKLSELKVGQVIRGKKLATTTPVVIKDASGKDMAKLPLGDKHSKWGHGRYAEFEGETVLVSDALEAFDGDVKQWCNTRIAAIPSADVKAVCFAHGSEKVELVKGTNSVWTLKGLSDKEELDTSKTYSLDSALSYLDFNAVVDPKLTEAELGFSTGHVYTVTVKEGSNTVNHVAFIGNKVKGGSDRYFKLDEGKWVFAISSYSAENMMKTRKDLVKVKTEAKKMDEGKASVGKK